MIYRICCVGKIKESYFTELIGKYISNMKRGDSIDICEVPDERIPSKASDKINEMIIKAEADRLMSVIDKRSYIIALCIDGKKTGKDELKAQIEKAESRGYSCVTFVIGGSLGLSDEIVKLANYRMSVSNMTYPHQLIRVALCESISRLYL